MARVNAAYAVLDSPRARRSHDRDPAVRALRRARGGRRRRRTMLWRPVRFFCVVELICAREIRRVSTIRICPKRAS